jgi:two-component system response regulator PilR (NtrC family)
MIHEQSKRASGSFVSVNCAALTETLLESELFGHARGAFTGAVRDKPGLFEVASNGTLFLDEIADLPLAMQVKLLRVIQEQKVRPVGASNEESVNVRILSATHQNLGKLVQAGSFREDLYYRINVIELHVPALRERNDDVLLLAGHILERLGAARVTLDESAKNALLRYSFPGNVRELENMLERAVTLCRSGSVGADDLAFRVHGSANAADTDLPPADLGNQLEDVQRQAIVDALERARYNKTAAAKILGLTFRQLRYRIKKLGIE